MIARLFDAAGVDYAQWRAMTWAALLVDLRASTFVRGPQGRQARAISGFIGQMLFYTVTGGFIAAFVMFSGDLFLSANLVLAYVMFMVGTAALLDHNAAITSPDDYHILGFRPVTSRTYFAARVANVLVYTSAMTTLFAYLPVAAFFVRWGAGVGLASGIAVYAASIFMAFVMVAAYSWLLRIIGPRRIKRVLSYLQFVFSFLVYGGYFLLSRLMSRSLLASIALPKAGWMLMIPPTWFASYLEIAAGRRSSLEIAPAAVSVVALGVLGLVISGRLSLDYADRLGALASATSMQATPRPGRRLPSFWFSAGEGRVVAMLVRSQFANDMKFRMSVLAILPLTIIYLLMGISDEGVIADPFGGGRPSQGLGMVTLAMMMFPAMLKLGLGRSDAFKASWIFFATPANRARLIRAATNVLAVTFVVPYLIGVAVIVGYFAEDVGHLIVHLAFIGLLSFAVLQVITLVDPELPFSKPVTKGRSSTRVFVLVAIVAVGSTFFPLIAPIVYRSTASIFTAFGALIAANFGLDRLTRMRIEARSSRLEFEG